VSGERGLVAKVVLLCALAATLASAVAGSASGDASMPPPVRDHGRGHWYERACLAPASRDAACGAQVVSSDSGVPLATSSPPVGALGPADFHTAYALPTTAPAGTLPTVAIVDAFDDPNIESDLAVYDAQYGLPPCTTANGCFTKVDQNGGTSFSSNTSWHLEIALDVETVHQICQNCKILLVEGSTNSFANLEAAENEAVFRGADVISNSYGGSEFSGETSDNAYYHPGVVITASTGDSGYGVEFPAASPSVVAVGGTSLHLNGDKTWASESVWSGAGSGCSAYVAKPSWQTDSGCSRRAVADVSADADPNTGAAIYDSIGASGGNAWYQVGGTSLSAPLIGAVYALAGSTGVADPASVPYAHAGSSSLHDIASGSNGSCSPSYLCTGTSGYDGPSGVGTPNGLGGFTVGAPAPDFTLAASPSGQTVAEGGSTSYTVTLSPQNGFSNGAILSISGLPSGATGDFTPSSVSAASPTSTLTVTVPTDTAGGTYTLTITGTSGTLTRTATTSLTVQAPPPPPVSLSASPSNVNAGGTVAVAWANVSGPTRNNWVGLYTPGAANSAYLGGFYDDDCGQTAGTTSVASGSCSYKLPTTGGTYEFRLFASKATSLITTSNAVAVTVLKASPTLSTSATANVALGASAKDTATLSGGSSATGTITFRVYGPSDTGCTTPLTTSTASVRGNGTYSSASFTPTQAGTYYWIASYGGDGNNNATAGTCGAQGESTVVAAPTLSVSTSSTPRGSAVTVSWSNVGAPVNTDWIGLFASGTPNSARVSWLYDATCSQRARGGGKSSGSCSFTMPSTASTYEFRLFSGSSGALLATSGSVSTT
jgi:hypothetical protein